MPRITIDESSSYSSGGSYFVLSDNGDKAEANILLDSEKDIEIYALHDIDVAGGKRTVNCLREPSGSLEDCPLCAAKNKAYVQIYLKMVSEGAVKIWTRGRTFYDKLKSLLRRYRPLSATTFEIEREGKKGDPKTTYAFYEVETSGAKNIDEVLGQFKIDKKDVPEILGNYVYDYSFDDLCDYLETGKLPDEQGGGFESGGRNYNRPRGTVAPEVVRRRKVADDKLENGEQSQRRRAAVEDEEAY